MPPNFEKILPFGGEYGVSVGRIGREDGSAVARTLDPLLYGKGNYAYVDMGKEVRRQTDGRTRRMGR